MPDAPLTNALDDEQLHDGALLICRYAHPSIEPCPCEACILKMMSLNEALSGIVFTERPKVLASVVELRTIIIERRKRGQSSL